MAFANVAGRAGFVLELDKSQLDRGLVEAEQRFDRFSRNIEAQGDRLGGFSRGLDSLLGDVRALRASRSSEETLKIIGERDPELAERYRRELAGVVSEEESLFRVRSRRASSIGPFRLAGVGLGAGTTIFAATQVVRELAQELDVAGDAAFTTEGRFRNVGASLIRGDLVGGIKALASGVETFDDLGIAAKDAGGALDDLQRLADTQGGKWRAIYEEARLVAEAYREVAAAAREALNASVGLRDPQGRLVVGGTLGQQFGVAANPPLPSFGTPEPSRTLPSQLEERSREAGRTAQLQDDLAAARAREAYAKRRLDIVKREGPLMEQRRKEYQDALDAVDSAQDRIDAQEKANQEKARQRAEEQKRQREAAAREAERQYRDDLGAREQLLRNAYQRALATPGRRDDLRAASALSTFLGRESRDPRLDVGERADFRSRQLGFLAERRKDREALAKAAEEATREELRLQEEILKNNVKAAGLTEKNKQDDIRAERRLRDFYRRGERDASLTRAEREAFRGDRLDTQKRLNELLGKTKDSESLEALFNRMSFRFLTGLQGINNQFGSNISADGAQTATNTWQQARLTERLVGEVTKLTRSVQHPGAKVTRNTLMENYGGVGDI